MQEWEKAPLVEAQPAWMAAPIVVPEAQPSPIAQEPTERSFVDEQTRQLGLTGRAAVEGLAGLGGIFIDPINEASRLVLNAVRDKQIDPQQGLHATVSSLLTEQGVPEPETKAEQIVQNIEQAMVGGGGVAGIAKGVAKVGGGVTKLVGQQLAAQPVVQTIGAGTGQAGAEIAKEQGVGTLGQVGASLIGGVGGAGIASKLSGTKQVASKLATSQDDIAAAEKQGIRVLTSDVKTPESFAAKWVQSTGEKAPIAGTGPVRVAQQKERVQAIKNVLTEFGGDDAASKSYKNVMADLLETRSSAIQKHADVKARIFKNVQDAGIVPVTRTTKEINDAIGKLSSLKTKGMEPAIETLKDWRGALKDQNILNIEDLRKMLGDAFDAPDLVSSKGTAQKYLNKIYGALREDIGDFVSKHGNKKDAFQWKFANKELSKMMGELDKTALKSALNKGTETPETIKALLFSKKASDIESLYKNLSPNGRANGRAAILEDAAEKATIGGEISPQKFMTYLDKSKEQFGVFFQGADLQKIKGLERALQITERASVAGVAPPTGQGLTIPVLASVLTDMFGGVVAGIASLGTVGGMARVYESKPVRNALIALSKTKIGTKEEAAMAKRLIAVIQSQSKEQKNGN
jgi:hypothetical protein